MTPALAQLLLILAATPLAGAAILIAFRDAANPVKE